MPALPQELSSSLPSTHYDEEEDDEWQLPSNPPSSPNPEYPSESTPTYRTADGGNRFSSSDYESTSMNTTYVEPLEEEFGYDYERERSPVSAEGYSTVTEGIQSEGQDGNDDVGLEDDHVRPQPHEHHHKKPGRGKGKKMKGRKHVVKPVTPPPPGPVHIEQLAPDTDDGLLGYHLVSATPIPSIHTSKMDIEFAPDDKLRQIADYAMDELEFNVNRYFGRYHPLKKHLIERPGSDISIKSDIDDDLNRIYANEPSTLDMWAKHFKDINFRYEPLTLPEELRVDKSIQVHLQRDKKRFGRGPKQIFGDNETQTRDMTFINSHDAERIYRHMYPLSDDYVKPPVPSRQESMEMSKQLAEEGGPIADCGKIGPKVKWSKKPRLLPPLPRDYYKVESFWTGSRFTGRYTDRDFEHGFFNYPLNTTYESEFYKGHIHSKKHKGIVKFPRGDTFEGEWKRGRNLNGHTKFADELEFATHNWQYIVPSDRRFYIERDVGVKAAGETLYNDRLPPPKLLPGWYDVGDGQYNPIEKVMVGFNGAFLRNVNEAEHKWILQKCRKQPLVTERYTPSFHIDRLPGCSAEKHINQ